MPVYKNTSNGMLNVYFKNTQGLQENLKLKPNQEVLLKFFLQDKYIPDGLEMVSQYPFNNILLTENQNSYNFTMNQNTYYYRIEPYGGQVSMYYETYYEELVQSESDYTYINGMFIPIEGDVDNPLYNDGTPYEELSTEYREILINHDEFSQQDSLKEYNLPMTIHVKNQTNRSLRLWINYRFPHSNSYNLPEEVEQEKHCIYILPGNVYTYKIFSQFLYSIKFGTEGEGNVNVNLIKHFNNQFFNLEQNKIKFFKKRW